MSFWKRGKKLPEILVHEGFRIMEFELGDGSKGWEVQRKEKVSDQDRFEWKSIYHGYFEDLEAAIEQHNRDVGLRLRRTVVSKKEVVNE